VLPAEPCGDIVMGLSSASGLPLVAIDLLQVPKAALLHLVESISFEGAVGPSSRTHARTASYVLVSPHFRGGGKKAAPGR